MKRETRRETNQRELAALTHNTLSGDQLKVIRKLNGATYLQGFEGTIHNRRTVEAVLQGRRHDTIILQAAILNAKKELSKLITSMDEIDNILCSKVTTQG